MDKIPNEVIELVVFEAEFGGEPGDPDWETIYSRAPIWEFERARSLALYTAVCRRWQHIFEPYTFKLLDISPKRLAQAEREGILNPRRLSYIRTIKIPIIFPWKFTPGRRNEEDDEIDDDEMGEDEEEDEVMDEVEEAVEDDGDDEWEDADEDEEDEDDGRPLLERRGYNHAIFDSSIRRIFHLLSKAPARDKPHIDMIFCIMVPEEFVWTGFYPPDEAEAAQTESGQVKPVYLDLQLEDNEELPEIPVVNNCTFELISWSLFFSPTVMCRMVSKMTQLKRLELDLSDEERRDPALRIEQRQGLAESLHTLPDTITHFELRYSRPTPDDHSLRQQNIIPPGQTYDNLSKALYTFSLRENLVKFVANGSWEADIFHPSDKDITLVSLWPKMETYQVGFLPVTPSGKWLAIDHPSTRLREEDLWFEDSDVVGKIFRGPVDPRFAKRVLPLLGRVATHSPKLKSMKMDAGVPSEYHIWYSGRMHGNDTEASKRKACMKITGKFIPKPDEEALRVWREAAEAHGQELYLEWNDHSRNPRRKEYFE
ncbi:hypothetical protein NM208_g11263 [Fusarium decemcellulare]|uniref:Uncharacterized protein n=1 Tax=Fusarium decemcellulare TaxID=57161 RepID=A0ACC1RUY9_9HYPO|nr:hypothetical protein NM208_g11263 [Fusarium decemcellulare]